MGPTAHRQPESAETTLPNACAVCGGDLELKVTVNVARTYCKHCHWVGHPDVTFTHNGLKVLYRPLGQA